jgi:hypothetical protein
MLNVLDVPPFTVYEAEIGDETVIKSIVSKIFLVEIGL